MFIGKIRGFIKKTRLDQAIIFFRNRSLTFQFLLIASFLFLVFFLVYFSISTLSSSDDHFFHFRFASEMVSQGFFSSFHDFQAIYFSKMAQGGEYFVYYNFLFYIAVLPFTLITPLYLGIKLYAVFAASVAFALLFLCLKKLDIKNPFVWTAIIIAITNVSSIWRFFLSRPYALAPSLLLLLIVFLYKRNYVGVFLVTMGYFYWHSATFFLPFCVALGYFIIEKFYRSKPDYKNLLCALGGTGAALLLAYIISPGFLLYMKEIIFGTYTETILGNKVPITEGAELYPNDFFNFIQGNALIFAAFITMFCVDIFNYVALKFKKITSGEYLFSRSQERKTVQTTVLILTALFFLGTVAVSGRFGDYFTLFAGLYIALSFDYVRSIVHMSGPAVIKKGILFGLGTVLVYLFISNMLFLQERMARGAGAHDFYQIGTWLARNSNPGDVVFETNWSWFPQLYYYSPQNRYSSGLEPRFSYVYDPELYWISENISNRGYICDQPKCPDVDAQALEAYGGKGAGAEKWAETEGNKIAGTLKNRFGVKYVVTAKPYLALNFIMDHNKSFERKMYNAEYGYSIYQVK
ncbi:MAG: hypothetical protein AAB365_02775 [Patescibacteria group bacterium]